MNKNTILLGIAIVLITYANGIVSTKFLSDKNIQLQSLIDENKRLAEKLDEYETEGMHVTVTMYHPVREQTDSTPNILADGTRIRTQEASNYKFVKTMNTIHNLVGMRIQKNHTCGMILRDYGMNNTLVQDKGCIFEF